MFLRIFLAFVTIIYTIAPSVADYDAQHQQLAALHPHNPHPPETPYF